MWPFSKKRQSRFFDTKRGRAFQKPVLFLTLVSALQAGGEAHQHGGQLGTGGGALGIQGAGFTAQVTASEAQLDTLAKSGYSCAAMPPWVVS